MPAGRKPRFRPSQARLLILVPLLVPAMHAAPAPAQSVSDDRRAPSSGQGLAVWLPEARDRLALVAVRSDADLESTGVASILRIYLDLFEPLEAWYGKSGPYAVEPLASVVARGEARFHSVLGAGSATAIRSGLHEVRETLDTIAAVAESSDVPGRLSEVFGPDPAAESALAVAVRDARTPEIAAILLSLDSAQVRFAAGQTKDALARVERMYLQMFEPLEPRLPGPLSQEIESLIHLRLRPLLARSGSVTEIDETFGALRVGLAKADVALAGETTFWFGAANSFVIIVREGLEAVLLIAAIVAYLKGSAAPKREERRVLAGAGLGIAATFGTWLMARTFLPVSGAGRELVEGATALVAVAVLLTVSHWLFQKAYLHDWKSWLRSRVGQAAGGSALAMAGLAFVAVYREGFETVLFYQALLFDSSAAAVLAGFLPGVALLLGLAIAVLRLGVKLPLRALFGVTNGILLYLAFVFLGKGIYNLHEAGIFAARPIGWLPDHGVLRQMFGFYPLAETLFAQVAFLTLLAGTWIFYVHRRRLQAAPAVRVPPSPPALD